MSNFESVIKEIVRIKEELGLKAHLLGMEAKTEWQALSKKVAKLEHELEHDLLTVAQKIGHSEEEFFVGDEQEIESLLTDFQNLKSKTLEEESNDDSTPP